MIETEMGCGNHCTAECCELIQKLISKDLQASARYCRVCIIYGAKCIDIFTKSRNTRTTKSII